MDQVFNLPPKFSEILTPNISAISPSLNFNDYSTKRSEVKKESQVIIEQKKQISFLQLI